MLRCSARPPRLRAEVAGRNNVTLVVRDTRARVEERLKVGRG